MWRATTPAAAAAAIRDVLVFGCLGHLEKFRGPVRGPKRVKNAKKWIFPDLGAVLDETPADQLLLFCVQAYGQYALKLKAQ